MLPLNLTLDVVNFFHDEACTRLTRAEKDRVVILDLGSCLGSSKRCVGVAWGSCVIIKSIRGLARRQIVLQLRSHPSEAYTALRARSSLSIVTVLKDEELQCVSFIASTVYNVPSRYVAGSGWGGGADSLPGEQFLVFSLQTMAYVPGG